jgi:hypothetical protein
MRIPVALTGFALLPPLLFGCGQRSSAPAGPGPSGSESADKEMADAVEILKSINKGIESRGPAAPGMNVNVVQVGTHRLKTTADVSVSTVINDNRAVVGLGGQTLAVEFDKGQILLDDTEKAKLPAGTKEVEIQYVAGKLSVTADGTAVVIPSAAK